MRRNHARREQGQTILLVDDDEGTREATRLVLELEGDGHRVLTAPSGAVALALLGQHGVQLVITAYDLSCPTGADLVRAIRAADPAVQILLQTGAPDAAPPLATLHALDIHGYHHKAGG